MLARRVLRWTSFVSTCLLLSSPVEAQQPDVEFNHLDGQETAYTLYLDHGEKFTIEILKTCEAQYAYEVRGILRDELEERGGRGDQPLAPKKLTITHNDAYGGYVVSISKLPPAPGSSCDGIDDLEPKMFIIFTPKEDWAVAVSGGFSVSNLTSPAYAIRSHPMEADKSQIVEDTSKQDFAKLGIATFVHMYREEWRWKTWGPALMFGLGISESNQAEYYIGGGLRLGDKATINGGIAFGSVSRLPAGVNLMEPVSADINLSELPTKVKRGVFMGISYSFINVGDRLQQPFAGSNGR